MQWSSYWLEHGVAVGTAILLIPGYFGHQKGIEQYRRIMAIQISMKLSDWHGKSGIEIDFKNQS
jgi:hypothetical protein